MDLEPIRPQAASCNRQELPAGSYDGAWNGLNGKVRGSRGAEKGRGTAILASPLKVGCGLAGVGVKSFP